MLRLNRIKNNLILFLLFLIVSNIKVNALVEPTSEFFVNDYANILSQKTENYIVSKSKALENVDGTQIVVVTIPSLEGESIESYATSLFREFGIGDKEKNNGLLLLLSLEEREFRVEVGYGLEGILPDGKTGRFQDLYIIPYLKDNKWDNGIKNGYDAFYSEIVKLNNLDLSYSNPKYDTSLSPMQIVKIMWKIFFYIIIGAIFGYFCGIFAKNNFLNRKSKRNYIIGYSIFISLFCLICVVFKFNHLIYLIIPFNPIAFILALLDKINFQFGNRNYDRQLRRNYYPGSSSGHSSTSSGFHSSSSGSSFGGGGSSGGGGSTRKF